MNREVERFETSEWYTIGLKRLLQCLRCRALQ